jgi:hypothetical protein
VRLEGLRQFKNPKTSAGIEQATSRLVAYCVKQLRYRVPRRILVRKLYMHIIKCELFPFVMEFLALMISLHLKHNLPLLIITKQLRRDEDYFAILGNRP